MWSLSRCYDTNPKGVMLGIYMYLDTVLNGVIAAHENLHL